MVPTMIQDIKKTMKLSASKECRKAVRKVMVRQLASIPLVGIKVGEFHTLERVSTPVFLHYIVTNIVGILVTWA